jgi:hypothetical protein
MYWEWAVAKTTNISAPEKTPKRNPETNLGLHAAKILRMIGP